MSSPSWNAILKNPCSKKYVLVTIVFGHQLLEALKKNLHPATIPGAIRSANDVGAEVSNRGTRYFFPPTLLEVPEILESISPQERRLDPIEVTLKFSRNAPLPDGYLAPGGMLSAIIRIDLWTPGMDLDECLMVFQGQVTSPPQFDHFNNGFTVSATDGEPTREARFPPGEMMLDRSSFPNILVNVEGRYGRQVIIGDFPYPILCPQVDSIGKQFYVCDHRLSRNPAGIEINGAPYGAKYNMVEYVDPAYGQRALDKPGPITLIEFEQPLTLELPFVTAYGGTGLPVNKSPILTLLEDYGNYYVDPTSRYLVETLPLALTVYVNANDSVIGLVKNRLIPQTPLIAGFRHSQMTFLPLNGVTNDLTLNVGSGLLALTGLTETDPANVYNALTVRYQRNVLSGSDFDLTRREFIMDSTHNTSGAFQAMLATSEHTYGRRLMPSMDFADLVISDESLPWIAYLTCAAMLQLTCKQHYVYTYTAPWYPGQLIPLNTTLYIQDDIEGIPRTKVRLIARKTRLLGPELTFMTENQ